MLRSEQRSSRMVRFAALAVVATVVIGCAGSGDENRTGDDADAVEETQTVPETVATVEAEPVVETEIVEEDVDVDEVEAVEEPEPVDDSESVDDPHPVRIRDISDLESSVIVEDDVGVVVRDGTRLSAKVFRPVEAGRYPVIMALTSYGKDLGPEEYPAVLDNAMLPDFDMGTFEVSPWTTWEGPDPATWVPEGYAVVYLDVRGYFDSEGDASVLSAQDAEDFYDVIEWAGAQEWSNGNVGTMGVSYLAISQWVAAGAKPPSLKAMVPWEGQTDSFREVLYHGGVPETAFTEFWLTRVNGLANTPPLPPFEVFSQVHPDPQAMKAFQPETFVRPALAEVPALVAATWSDQGLHTRGSFEGYKQSSATAKWLYTHGQPKWSTFYGDEAVEYQQAFFDHFLKGVDNGMEARPAVRLEVRETLEQHEVRFEDEWPLARTEYRPLYLDGTSGELADTQPDEASVVEYNPLTGAATFTITFDEDTELTGNMKLRLWVSTTDGTDMDLFVGVHKLDVAGDEVHFYAKTGYTKGPVAMGWLRVSERALDEDRSTPWQPVLSHDKPQPLTAGEIVPVDIEILPSSTLFRAGESLQLTVQGADLFEHPALAHAYSQDINAGVHAIHTGEDFDSHLLIPEIPR
jgi:predicted acyl esterase